MPSRYPCRGTTSGGIFPRPDPSAVLVVEKLTPMQPAHPKDKKQAAVVSKSSKSTEAMPLIVDRQGERLEQGLHADSPDPGAHNGELPMADLTLHMSPLEGHRYSRHSGYSDSPLLDRNQNDMMHHDDLLLQ